MTPRTISVLGWAVAFGVVLAWEGFMLARRGTGWMAFSDLLEAIRWPVVRWVAFALWLWFGWHVFVRTWQMLPGR